MRYAKAWTFLSFLTVVSKQFVRRRKAPDDEEDGIVPGSNFRALHHGDILQLRECVGDSGCDICALIFQEFERIRVGDLEYVRGLPIVFRSFNNMIQVCYDWGTDLIELCCLNVYMNEAHGK